MRYGVSWFLWGICAASSFVSACGGRIVDRGSGSGGGPDDDPVTGGGGTVASVLCQVELDWERRFVGEPGRLLGSAVSSPDGLVIEGRFFDCPGESSTLLSLDPRGVDRWERAFEQRYARLARYGDGYVIAGQKYPDLFVTAVDSAGNIRWEAEVGSDKEDFVSELVVDGDSVVVVGSSVTYVGSPADVLVSRIGGEGQVEWTGTYGESSNIIGQSRDERVIGAHLDREGRVVVAAQRWMDGGDGPPWVFAVERSGEVAWEYFAGVEYVRGSSWVFLPTSVGGWFLAGNLPAGSGIAGGAARVFHIDSRGAFDWEASLDDGSGAQQVTHDAIELDSGGYAVVGYSASSTRGTLWRLDARGSTLWTAGYDEVGAGLAKIREMPDGGFVIGGARWGISEDDRIFVLRVDSRGREHWRYEAYGTGVTDLGDLFADPGGRVRVIGAWSEEHDKESVVLQLSETCIPR